MSLLRRSRFPAGTARKPPKPGKKKPCARQEWDALRHEKYKSKNKALIHLEQKEKPVKSTWKKMRSRAPESLEKKKLALMREIISDQYQLQDVLERSDQAMAVVKDLFGDVPHWHSGFPNVTVAPDYDVESSQGPIIQKRDLPTQLSMLSESIMDPQALNEAEECSFVCRTNGEGDVCLNTRSSTDTNRVCHLLKEDAVASCQQEASKQQVSTLSTTEEAAILLTPAAGFQSLEHTALNATNVVKKVHSRFQNEEQSSDGTYVIQQVLNAKGSKQKHTSTKGKKKQNTQTPAGQMRINLSTASTSVNHPNGQRSSLEYLNQIMHNMECEMEEYEKWMGHEIQYAHNSQGISGFTHSLVNALCRMLRCLKETETKVRQEIMNRQQLKRELNEHRALIDALTVEVLLLKEENLLMQSTFQQNLVVQEEQSLTCVSPAADSGRMTGYGETGEFSVRNPEATKESPVSNHVGAKMDMLDLLHVDLPSKESMLLHPPDKIHPKSLASACIFQPAVMLSPPLQKSSQALPLGQDECIMRQPNGEQKPSASRQSLVVQEDGSPFVQRGGGPLATKPLQNSHCSDDHLLVNTSAELGRGFGAFTERISPGASMMHTQNDDLQQQIAELTLQNSVIKSQLSKFSHCHQETSSNLQQPVTKQDGSIMERQRDSQAISKVKELPKSLDERIADLNRQSAEARGKLLLLTNQQRLSSFISVSPPVSPIPSPPVNLTENGRRTIEVSVPVAETLDSSKEDTLFPVNGTSTRREACNQAAVAEDLRENRIKQEPADHELDSYSPVSEQSGNLQTKFLSVYRCFSFVPPDLKTCIPQSKSLGNVQLRNNSHRIKTENQKEEGWFALSTHIG